MKKTFRYIVKKDGDVYVALCLDVCMAAQGKTIDEAKKDLEACFEIDYWLAREEGFTPHGDIIEPKGWFKECYGYNPGPFDKVYTLTVDV